jgi:hypothetical protein
MHGRREKELIFTSAYIPTTHGPFTNYCRTREEQLMNGCDASAHSVIWVRTGTRPRGESLIQYLVKLIFFYLSWKEVTQMTLGTEDVHTQLSEFLNSPNPSGRTRP